MGQPKAWLPFGDEVLLQRIVRILRTVVSPVVVVAAPGQELPSLAGDVAVVRDERENRGPLQGLAAGLRWLHDRVDAAYLSSCDAPFLQPRFVERIIHLLEDHSICVPCIDGRHHPLAAVYRCNVLPSVDELLQAGRLRPFYLFDQAKTRVIDEEEIRDVDPSFQSLRNVNTPEDYEAALREIG